MHGAVYFRTSLILELWRYRDFRDKSPVNGLFGSNLSVDASEVSCASRRMDPYLGVTPGGRSVETTTQASDWDASLSGTHCNHSRPTFLHSITCRDDRLLGGTDNLRSGGALCRRFSTPLRERQHHPHLGRQTIGR